ncbi:hypothetical protein EVAR_24333_1 [Eumeta japonica]|uniref:Uncharacterized protein n=1 Tax=Eumeta variegata TaxID=151549 RepID=A0A4C1VLQ6_EUMVA|nr:hypothetical protein EVAR_24333_1 [Eumeta japonica]
MDVDISHAASECANRPKSPPTQGPITTSTQVGIDRVTNLGFPSALCAPNFGRNDSPLGLVLAILTKINEARLIFRNFTKICALLGIRVEIPRRKGGLGHCHRCQWFGHAAANYHADPSGQNFRPDSRCRIPSCNRTLPVEEKLASEGCPGAAERGYPPRASCTASFDVRPPKDQELGHLRVRQRPTPM